MAKELRLVPKLKYDRLVEKVGQNSEQLHTTDIQDIQDSLTENQTMSDREDIASLLQSGKGYVPEFLMLNGRKKTFLGLRIDIYSDQRHFHIDCKQN